jgi:hypothetical protein
MSTITRYYGTVNANTNILTTIDTSPIPINTSFTIDVFYGGRAMDNYTPPEQTWMYRYILTYDTFDSIVNLRDTHNVFGYTGGGGGYPLESTISGTNINLLVNTSVFFDPTQTVTIYDCYLNYI